MAIQSSILSPWAAVRILAAGSVAAMAFACVAGENSGQTVIDVPLETVRLQPHQRPVFLSMVPESNAVELTGTIEFCQMPRQPRPLSAPPRRIDILASSLTSALGE